MLQIAILAIFVLIPYVSIPIILGKYYDTTASKIRFLCWSFIISTVIAIICLLAMGNIFGNLGI